MSEDLNEFTLVERRKLLEIQAEAKRLCALNAALQKTIDDWRVMTCTWCGLEIAFDDDNVEAILEQMNQHALTCPADPRTQEIAALRARAERAEELITRVVNRLDDTDLHSSNCEHFYTREDNQCDCGGSKLIAEMQEIVAALDAADIKKWRKLADNLSAHDAGKEQPDEP